MEVWNPAETSAAAVTEELREFLSRFLGVELGADEDYFALGLVDSLFALELVTFVEHRFGFTVEVDDLDLDHFRTIGRLTAFVLAKTAALAENL